MLLMASSSDSAITKAPSISVEVRNISFVKKGSLKYTREHNNTYRSPSMNHEFPLSMGSLEAARFEAIPVPTLSAVGCYQIEVAPTSYPAQS